MPLRIRPATLDDMPEVGRLGARLVALHHEWDPARFFSIPNAERGYARWLSAQLRDDDTVILVAVDGRKIVGYAYASLMPRDWSDLRAAGGKLHDLYVDAAARRRGVGRQLLDAAIAALEKLGARQVVLMTASRTRRAPALFRDAGFRPTMLEMTREADAGRGRRAAPAPPPRGASRAGRRRPG